MSYQAVPSVRVSVSTENMDRTRMNSYDPALPQSAAYPRTPSPSCAGAGSCPIRQCGCRPPCPGRCRRASMPQEPTSPPQNSPTQSGPSQESTPPPPSSPQSPPRRLAYDDREIMHERLSDASERGLLKKPTPPRQYQPQASPDEDDEGAAETPNTNIDDTAAAL